MKLETRLLASCLAALAVGLGCGSPCDDLAKVCPTCDADRILACETVVRADDSDLCDLGIDFYDPVCNE